MLLPPQFQSEPLKTLGPPIRKNEKKKPVEVYIGNGVWRVNGRLETRIRENEPADQYPSWVPVPPAPVLTEVVSEIDIPLPEFKPVWRRGVPPKTGVPMGLNGKPFGFTVSENHIQCWHDYSNWEWLDEGC